MKNIGGNLSDGDITPEIINQMTEKNDREMVLPRVSSGREKKRGQI